MSEEYVSQDSKGKQLAELYCGSCHKVPLPQELDKTSWSKYILPRMRKFMSIDSISANDDFFEVSHLSEMKDKGVFRDFAYIKEQDWTAIENYYIKNAPNDLFQMHNDSEENKDTIFHIEYPSIYSSPPSTSLIRIDKEQIWWGDIHSNGLYILNNDYEVIRSFKNPAEAPIDICAFEKGKLVTYMGSFSPTDDTLGKVYFLDIENNYKFYPLISGLKRPVDIQVCDLNRDGKEDLVISEFGKWLGQLSLFINNGNGSFEKEILSFGAGSVGSKVHDFNNDGILDIIGLFAQGDEHMSIFYGNINGTYEEHRILEFSPTFGSNSFQLVDFNKDNHMDIMLVNGDLADYPLKGKPYQGIRIFLNDDKNNFNLFDFLSVSGIYQANLIDFDLDGDKDIFCNSFFPHKKNPEINSLQYFENKSGKYYKSTIDADKSGRWMLSSTGDIDSDGDIDVILGSLIMELPGYEEDIKKWIKNGLPFILLKNSIIN